MATAILIFTLLSQVATPGEMQSLGFLRNTPLPRDVYVAGLEEDEVVALATQGDLIYLNGPGLASLKTGATYSIVRPEGKIRNRARKEKAGIYYIELGTVRIEAAGREYATATVLASVAPIQKGDLLIGEANRPPVTYEGTLSNRLTPYPKDSLITSRIVGQNDTREMSAGDFCFIGAGTRDGVNIGNRFVIYREPPAFDPQDLSVDGSGQGQSYRKIVRGSYKDSLILTLKDRKLPPRALGDFVIVDLRESTATGKIVNSLAEIHIGDIAAKK